MALTIFTGMDTGFTFLVVTNNNNKICGQSYKVGCHKICICLLYSSITKRNAMWVLEVKSNFQIAPSVKEKKGIAEINF